MIPLFSFELFLYVAVTVNVPIEPLVEKVFTENGHYVIEPSNNYDGIGRVNIDVSMPLEVNREITITENGQRTIAPSGSNVGMRTVTITRFFLSRSQ